MKPLQSQQVHCLTMRSSASTQVAYTACGFTVSTAIALALRRHHITRALPHLQRATRTLKAELLRTRSLPVLW